MKNLLPRTPCAITSSLVLELVQEKSSVVFIYNHLLCALKFTRDSSKPRHAFFPVQLICPFVILIDLLICYIDFQNVQK